MARQSTTGKLPAVSVKNSKPRNKPFKLSDGGGMYLLINPNGSKYWRLKYRIHKREKVLALGVYPNVSMADARDKVLEAKRLLDKGIDPGTYKKQIKSASQHETFHHVAKAWHKTASGEWIDRHADKVWRTLKADALPYLGNMATKDIKTSDVLYVVKKIESRGALDVASRIKQRINSIFRYAIQIGCAEFNPVDALTNVIETKKVKHLKSLKQAELPDFLNALDSYPGHALTQYALQLIVNTFVRPGELRSAEWEDVDFAKSIWRVPAEKMKMGEEHIVPLSSQSLEILERVLTLTGPIGFVFPSTNSGKKPMSANTLTHAIRKRLGFDATAHGFRTTASTILNESGYRVDVIERQLAHGERNKVRDAYNRSLYLAERTEMMQWYSDYLDSLKTGADVVPLRTKNVRFH
jgi:integrase